MTLRWAPKSHTYFGTRICAPDSHAFCGVEPRAERVGEMIAARLRNPTFFGARRARSCRARSAPWTVPGAVAVPRTARIRCGTGNVVDFKIRRMAGDARGFVAGGQKYRGGNEANRPRASHENQTQTAGLRSRSTCNARRMRGRVRYHKPGAVSANTTTQEGNKMKAK